MKYHHEFPQYKSTLLDLVPSTMGRASNNLLQVKSTSGNDEECLLQVRVLDSDDVNEVLKHFD